MSKVMSKSFRNCHSACALWWEFVHANIIVLTLPNYAFEWVEAEVLGVVTLTDCLGNRELTPSAESRCWPPPDVVIFSISIEVKSWLCNARLTFFSQCLMLPNPTAMPLSLKDSFDSFLSTSLALHWSLINFLETDGWVCDFFFVAVWLPYVLGCHSLPLANLHSLWACPSWQIFPSQQNASMKQQHASP